MKVSVIGAGYVGLVTGACFAEQGNEVICIDIDRKKVARMQAGDVPIYEPGLDELFLRNTQEGRLNFSTELASAADSDVVFLALPTPPGEDGSADLSYVQSAAHDLGPLLKNYTVIVDKSTVPVGTSKLVRTALSKGSTVEFDVVANPEFLREGQAISDFMHPDRVVIGSSSAKAIDIMTRLYRPFVSQDPDQRFIVTDETSAELVKYAANAALANRISFINELSRLSEKVGADIDAVRRGIGADSRIGNQFLNAGPGYGGSCFPKDTEALLRTGEQYGVDLEIVRATISANEKQKEVIPNKIIDHYGKDLSGKVFALWGLAFKADTDDIRVSPALVIIDKLVKRGAQIVAYDPEAIPNVQQQLKGIPEVRYAKDPYDALKGTDALIIATNWGEFSAPNFAKIKTLLKEPLIFDGRNMYTLQEMAEVGFGYVSIGRKNVNI